MMSPTVNLAVPTKDGDSESITGVKVVYGEVCMYMHVFRYGSMIYA